MQAAHPILKKATLGVSGFLVVATGLIGFMHTRPGHPLLMKVAGVAGCPLGRATAAEVDAARRAAVAHQLGTEVAPARPALGFALDRTTLPELRSWEARIGADCTEEREGTLVKCTDVPAAAVGRPAWQRTITEVSFGFSPRGPLVSVTTLYSHRSADDTSRIAEDARVALEKDLGQAHRGAGSLERKGSVATLSYRFRDYAADLTASPVPGSGHVVRELFVSANNL